MAPRVAVHPRERRLTTYDQARQFGKTYVGALNTGEEAFAALFADGAAVTVGGAAASPELVRQATPPGRSALRGSRMRQDGEFAVIVRVRGAASVEDREHVMRLDASGRIVSLSA
ncbi:MAG: hypothetical protein AB1416_10635 [Actinomycetota bacterium]